MPDPDLEKRGWGGLSSRLLDKGGGVQKIFFQPLQPQFGLKIREGACPPPPAAPLDLPLGKILTDKARVLTSVSRIMYLGLFIGNAKLSKLKLESTGYFHFLPA